MARKALNMSTIKEIRRMKALQLSERAIARALKIHRNTVKKHLSEATVVSVPVIESEPSWQSQLNWEEFNTEALKGVPIQVLWEEQHEAGSVPVQYPAFWKQLRRRFPNIEKSMHRVFAPGSRCEIDYCDGIDILDPVTGEIKTTEFFVGVLCNSRYAFAEFTWSQKSEDFLTSHVHMLEYFGGVPHVVSPDNLKSAVTKAHKYDPVINPAYTKLAEYYDFAVVPARVRRPKDKAIVERTIQIFQRWFYFLVRHRTFTSLSELNQCLREHLIKFNQKTHRIFRCSRIEMFENEKSHLKPLSGSPYEVSTHKRAKLHEDCHLIFDKNYYSAPYDHRGHTLDIWATHNAVEIYKEGTRVAFHRRYLGHGKFFTKKEHYPPEHRAYAEATPQYLLKQAERIGPHTKELAKSLLSDGHPLRYLRRLQGIVRLAKQYSREQMEKACEVANQFGNRSYPFVERLLKNKALLASKSAPEVKRSNNPYLRGEELFH